MAIQKRYDFVLLFDVQDGNPNGDPDAGNPAARRCGDRTWPRDRRVSQAKDQKFR